MRSFYIQFHWATYLHVYVDNVDSCTCERVLTVVCTLT